MNAKAPEQQIRSTKSETISNDQKTESSKQGRSDLSFGLSRGLGWSGCQFVSDLDIRISELFRGHAGAVNLLKSFCPTIQRYESSTGESHAYSRS
jgi:hypothetical protein